MELTAASPLCAVELITKLWVGAISVVAMAGEERSIRMADKGRVVVISEADDEDEVAPPSPSPSRPRPTVKVEAARDNEEEMGRSVESGRQVEVVDRQEVMETEFVTPSLVLGTIMACRKRPTWCCRRWGLDRWHGCCRLRHFNGGPRKCARASHQTRG